MGLSSSLPVQRAGPTADHAVASLERRVAAVADRTTGLRRLAARLAGPGRQGEALSARQQRRRESSRPPSDHERTLWRGLRAAPATGDRPRDRRLAAAGGDGLEAGGLPSERRTRGIRGARAGARLHERPGSRSTSRWPSPGRQRVHDAHGSGRRVSTGSIPTSCSGTSGAMPSKKLGITAAT